MLDVEVGRWGRIITAEEEADGDIHVIFSWTQIGRFGFTDREIGSQIGRFFLRQKIFNFSVKNCYLQHLRSL